MQKIYFIPFLALLLIQAGCSKIKESYDKPVSSVPEYRFNSFCAPWQLNTYTIKTDRQDYLFTGAVLDEHALKSMNINKDLSYKSANDLWSGKYSFMSDSSTVLFTPDETQLVPFFLHIDGISGNRLFLTLPSVAVNPEKSNADAYEKFVAYEGLKWLYEHQVDIKDLKSIQIEFFYSK